MWSRGPSPRPARWGHSGPGTPAVGRTAAAGDIVRKRTGRPSASAAEGRARPAVRWSAGSRCHTLVGNRSGRSLDARIAAALGRAPGVATTAALEMRSLAVRGMEMMRIVAAVGHIAVATGTGRQSRKYHSNLMLTLWFLFYQETSQIETEIMCVLREDIEFRKMYRKGKRKPFDVLNLIKWRCDDVW